LDLGVEIDVIGHDVETADQLGADASQPAGQPTRCARAVEFGDVDAVVVAIDLDQALQAALEQPDLGRGRPFLRREVAGRVDEAGTDVTGDGEADTAKSVHRVQSPQRAQGAAGGGGSADA